MEYLNKKRCDYVVDVVKVNDYSCLEFAHLLWKTLISNKKHLLLHVN